MNWKHVPKGRELAFIAALAIICVVLVLIPNPFADDDHANSRRVRAEVMAVDDSGLQQFGIIKQGDQVLTLRISDGRFRGTQVEAFNILIGKLELDKYFAVGDQALTVLDLDPDSGDIVFATAMDHYRIHVELVLAALFAAVLIGFAGWTGLKAILSFFFAGLVIWKVMLPLFLLGVHPVAVSLVVVLVLTAAIQFLIGGLNRQGLVAFLGATLGVLVTCGLALLFGTLFRVHGAVRPFSETLLYSGFPHLDLSLIMFSGIFLASSGAVMDVAMDISASMREVHENHPLIHRGRLVRSGFAVGRAIIGTMTTTLLLAHSGGYTMLLMVFLAQGVPAANVFNINYVAAEILHTLVGSFGLVLVAPATAIVGGLMYVRRPAQPVAVLEPAASPGVPSPPAPAAPAGEP